MNRIQQFRAIQNATGLFSKKEVEIEKFKRFISKHFNNTIAYEEEVLINGSSKKLIILKDKGRENENVKKIIAHPNETLSVGQIVECYGAKWIITKVDLNQQVYAVGRMTLAPNILKFQDSKGNILSYPYFVDKTVPSLNENKMISSSDTVRLIKLPFDEYTQQFFIGKRFMGEIFNGIPQCWKVIDLNSEEERGLLFVTLEKDEFNNKTDSVEYGVCNYFEPNIEPKPSEDEGYVEIVYSGKAEVKAGGSFKTFQAVFYDSERNVLDGIVAEWQIVKPIGYENSVVVEVNRNTLKIKALDVNGIINKKILVRLMDNEKILKELEVNIASLI